MAGVCVKLKKDKEWKFDETWGYSSCGPDGNVGIYQVVSDNNELGDINYEVRSAADPLVMARHLTNDRQNFGLPGLYWKIMGFVSLLLSLFLIAQPTIYFKKRIYGELKESPVLIEFQPRKPDINANFQ